MKLFALTAFFILLLTASASASWAYIPLDQLVQDSDLIVVGTLDQVSAYSDGETDYGQGTIAVHEVIWGDAQPGDLFTLKWQNGTGVICPRVEHAGEQGQEAIWLLTKKGSGEVRADYPSRFVALTDRAKVERILARKNVCLRAPQWSVSPAEPAAVSIVFRNPTEEPVEFPGMKYVNGVLSLDATADLGVYRSYWDKDEVVLDWKRVEWIPNRVQVADEIEPTTVPPKGEYRLTIDLRDLVDLPPGESYQVRFEALGRAAANQIHLYIDEAKRQKSAAGISLSRPFHRVNRRLTLGLCSTIAALGFCLLLASRRRYSKRATIVTQDSRNHTAY